MVTTTEGTIRFRGYRTAYEIVGDLDAAAKEPLLVVHGGPGFPHDYLENLAVLAEDGRPVVFYDQLGCGSSDRPDDDSLWVIDTFVDELATVRDALGLDHVHLLGHSWGGWLVLDYALRQPDGLTSLVLASTCASVPAYAAVARQLKETLAPSLQELLDAHEAAGTTGDPGYEEATMAFYTRWICRRQPFPDHVLRSFAAMNDQIYAVMQGPEWNITGNLLDWDVTERLGELELPVLVTSGRYDVMTPALVAPLVERIPGALQVTFEDSAHFAMVEEPERFRDVIESFCSAVELSALKREHGLLDHPQQHPA